MTSSEDDLSKDIDIDVDNITNTLLVMSIINEPTLLLQSLWVNFVVKPMID